MGDEGEWERVHAVVSVHPSSDLRGPGGRRTCHALVCTTGMGL